MSLDYTVCGISPLAISYITTKRGRRFGPHPFAAKLFSRKYPLVSLMYNPHAQSLCDGFYCATVNVYGSGKLLLSIPCKSNREAQELKDSMTDKLNYFLERMTKDQK